MSLSQANQPTNKANKTWGDTKEGPLQDERQAYVHQWGCLISTHRMCNTPLALEDKHKHMPANHHADQQLECPVPTLQICSCCSSMNASKRRSAAVFPYQTLQNADLQLCFRIKHFRMQICSCVSGSNASERRSVAVFHDQTLQNADLWLCSMIKRFRMQFGIRPENGLPQSGTSGVQRRPQQWWTC